jgi:Zn-dependent protease
MDPRPDADRPVVPAGHDAARSYARAPAPGVDRARASAPGEDRVRAAGPPRRRRGRGVPLGRPFGFPLYLSPFWPVLAAVLTVVYGQLVGDGGAAEHPVARYGAAALFVACLVVSVLLHEVGHAVACRGFGIRVRAVTIELLGGYTEMDADAPTPRAEAAVSLAGPAVSLVLAGLAGLGSALLAAHPLVRTLALQLAVCNAVLAGFNALPGLPLDGGRALRALVWARTGDAHRGDRVAGLAGRGVALACVLASPALYGLGALTTLGAVLVLVVGVSLGYGADEAMRLSRRAAGLTGAPGAPAGGQRANDPRSVRGAATGRAAGPAEESR